MNLLTQTASRIEAKPSRLTFVKKCRCFIAIGQSINEVLEREKPSIQQIQHTRVIEYLARRFSTGCYQIARSNWEPEIREFAKLCPNRTVKDLLQWAKKSSEQIVGTI